MVHALFNTEKNEWNEKKLRSLLCQEDAHYALNIIPSQRRSEDKIVWNYSRSGEYSVKTGYYLQRQLMEQETQHHEGTNSISSDKKGMFFKNLEA